MSTLASIPHEPDCEDYQFLDQPVDGLEFGLDSFLLGSVDTPTLKASNDEAYAMPSSVSSGTLCWVSTHSVILGCSLLLASNVILYGARLGHYFNLYHRQVK